jgi:cytochrome P450
VEVFAPAIPRIIDEHIDDFIEVGHCDLIGQLARTFPPRVFFRLFFGINDEDEITQCMAYVHKMDYEPDAPDLVDTMTAWFEWCSALIDRRRVQRRDDMIDALIFGTVAGRPLTDAEIAGGIQILILGGFSTTADALGSIVMMTLEDARLYSRLRADTDCILGFLDEFFRNEPPVVGLSRTCLRDTDVGGNTIRAGDHVILNAWAANHDPREFDDPHRLNPERPTNRHLTFGAGPHRCIGSNLARLNLRLALEQIVRRLDDITVPPGSVPRRTPASLSRGWAYIPLKFRPRPRSADATDAGVSHEAHTGQLS